MGSTPTIDTMYSGFKFNIGQRVVVTREYRTAATSKYTGMVGRVIERWTVDDKVFQDSDWDHRYMLKLENGEKKTFNECSLGRCVEE